MSFLTDIQRRVLLFDGALHSLLCEKGALQQADCPEMLNSTQPMNILDIHQAYLDAGADIITANTFGANTLRLEKYDLASRMQELVQSGVALCRETVSMQGREVYVAASIGPTGELYTRDEQMPALMYHAFFAQCAASEAAGADIILIETMSDLCEARLAILAARAATRLPILCSFILEDDGSTFAGNPPEVLALTCSKIGAVLVGVNCGLGPEDLFNGYSRLAGASSLPTFAQPNAEDTTMADSILSPEAIAGAMEPYLQCGAAAIGGCCGTTPAHTRALRKLLDEYHGNAHRSSAMGERICSTGKQLPMQALEPYTPLHLAGLTQAQAMEEIKALAAEQTVLHIDFADWGAEAIDRLIFTMLPHVRNTPVAFHLYSAKQANAALLAYPGIAAVYAHSDTYRVLKAAVRYGAEVIS